MGLDTVELLYNIEIHFAIRIPDQEAAQSNTVQEVYEMVLRNLPANADSKKVYADVVQLIAEQTGLEIHEIQPHQSLTSDLGMD